MTLGVLAPLIVATIGAALMARFASQLRPHHGARLCALSLLAVLGTAWITSLSLALAYIAHLPMASGRFVWCRQALSMHEAPPTPTGIAALAVADLGTLHLIEVLRRWRAERGTNRGHLQIVDSDRAFAYTEPGARGGIILSSTLASILNPKERRIVLAHEHSHLRHRHDRYLLLAILADPIPVLNRVANQLRLAVERWADEDAATTVGDRKLVARTIAHAALATIPSPKHLLAATGSHVPTRVKALTATTDPGPWATAAITLGIASLAASILELHHLVPVLATLSRH